MIQEEMERGGGKKGSKRERGERFIPCKINLILFSNNGSSTCPEIPFQRSLTHELSD